MRALPPQNNVIDTPARFAYNALDEAGGIR